LNGQAINSNKRISYTNKTKGEIEMLTTTLIGIQTLCVVTSTTYMLYKLTQDKIKLTLIKKEGKFKYYRVGGK
jgi:hypothetical protein